MSVVLELSWPGVTPELYEQARELVDWENVPARGGVFHVVWFEGEAMRIVDVWESEEAFRTFMSERLLPVVAEMGIEGQPQATFHPAHRYFNVELASAAA
jgi:hypothetical protein